MIDPNTPIACLTVGQFIELQRSERARPSPPKQELPKFLKPPQLAEMNGWKLTTVYQNHHNGLIPGARKIGNRLLFETEIILAWIESNAIPTKAEKVLAHENKIIKL